MEDLDGCRSKMMTWFPCYVTLPAHFVDVKWNRFWRTICPLSFIVIALKLLRFWGRGRIQPGKGKIPSETGLRQCCVSLVMNCSLRWLPRVFTKVTIRTGMGYKGNSSSLVFPSLVLRFASKVTNIITLVNCGNTNELSMWPSQWIAI